MKAEHDAHGERLEMLIFPRRGICIRVPAIKGDSRM